MNIPLVDLKAQYSNIKKEVNSAIFRVVKSARFVGGDEVKNFEEDFAHFIGAKYCVSVGCGTDALILGIRGLDLSGNDEIIVPANTFNATAAGISENNLKPVIVDINEEDNGINLADLQRKINSRTKAIIIVHLYGQPEKIEEINTIIRKSGKKIHLIEDACQAHGAQYKNRKVGVYGTFSAFSFYPGKNLGCYGDGGAIITNNSSLNKKYRMYKDHGQIAKYNHQVLGVNSNLDAIQSAILSVKLKYINSWNNLRREKAQKYNTLLKDISGVVSTPKEFPLRRSIYHLYVIRVQKRNALLNFLNKKGIQAGIHYPTPIHLQQAYKYLGYKSGDLPISEKISQEILSLPIYPELTDKQINFVVKNIRMFYNNHKNG